MANNWHQPPPLPNLVRFPRGYMPLNAAGMDLANLAAWHQTRIGDMGMLAAPPEGAVTQPLGMPANPTSTSKRVWIDEPPGAVPFDEQDIATLSGVAGTTTAVMTITVPAGFDGIVRWISNNLTGGATFVPGEVVWGININGRPYRNFGTINMEKGTVYQGRQISPLRLFANNVLTYTVTEQVSGLSGQTVVSATGYYYPSKGVS